MMIAGTRDGSLASRARSRRRGRTPIRGHRGVSSSYSCSLSDAGAQVARSWAHREASTVAVPNGVGPFECFLDRWLEAARRQASEERVRRHDLLHQPDPRLLNLSFGERAHHRGRAYRRRGSLATAHQRSPNSATRSLDLHGDPVPVAPLVPAPEPRVEAPDPSLSARPVPEYRGHP